jgi:hypothetical protein
MQHLDTCLKERHLSATVTYHLALVRFLAYHRINPHAPPLVRAPVNSFEFQPCDRTPQVVHLMLSLGTLTVRPTPSEHSLRRGLPGYLILFAPHAFVPQRQYWFSDLPSQLVFYNISKHFTATCYIPPTSTTLKNISFNGSSTVELEDFTTDLISRLRTL